jgi:hypothetical protein
MLDTLSCFGFKKKTSTLMDTTQIIGFQAKRISGELERKSDQEFALRMQGFEEDDPAIQAKREEENKRKEEAIEAQRKEEEEAFRRRMQYL